MYKEIPYEYPENVLELIDNLKCHWRFSEIESIKYRPLFLQSTSDTTGILSITPKCGMNVYPSLPVGILSHITDYDSTANIEFRNGAFEFMIYKHRPSCSSTPPQKTTNADLHPRNPV